MLLIYLRWDQLELLPQLHTLFPDLVLVMIEGVLQSYHASFQPGMQGAQQYRFLKEHQIAHIDFEQRREAIVRGFFQGVELEGEPICSLQFRRVLTIPSYHSVILSTTSNVVCLRFPPHWNPPHLEQRSSYEGWIYVHQESLLLSVSTIGAAGAIEQLLYQSPHAVQVEAWLKDQHYVQVIATNTTERLAGLYRPHHGTAMLS